MEDKQVIEQQAKEAVRELTEPEMDKVVGGANRRIESEADDGGLPVGERMLHH